MEKLNRARLKLVDTSTGPKLLTSCQMRTADFILGPAVAETKAAMTTIPTKTYHIQSKERSSPLNHFTNI